MNNKTNPRPALESGSFVLEARAGYIPLANVYAEPRHNGVKATFISRNSDEVFVYLTGEWDKICARTEIKTPTGLKAIPAGSRVRLIRKGSPMEYSLIEVNCL